jgi:hypothetical protein
MREAVRLSAAARTSYIPSPCCTSPHLATRPWARFRTCSATPLTLLPSFLRCASAAARPIARAAPIASSRRCSTRPPWPTRRRTSRSTAAPRRACRPPPSSRCGPASAESSSGATSCDLATPPACGARSPSRRRQRPLPAGARALPSGLAADPRAARQARRAVAHRRKRRGRWARWRGRGAPRRAKTCRGPCRSRYRGSRRVAP